MGANGYLLHFFSSGRESVGLLRGSTGWAFCTCAAENLTTHPHMGLWASQVSPVVKNLPASTGDLRNVGLIPGLGRSPGGDRGNPLQQSCLEKPRDRRVWQAAVQRVAESDAEESLKQLPMAGHMNLLAFPSLFPRPSNKTHALKLLSQALISEWPRLRQVQRRESTGRTTHFIN